MKALSVRNPWAHLIAHEIKTIEVRSWYTKYRGPLLICVSKNRKMGAELADSVGELHRFLSHKYYFEDRGHAIAIVDLVDCRRPQPHDEASSLVCIPKCAWSWVLANARRIDPFPVKGRLGLFDI